MNVDGDDVLADYYHMNRAVEAPPVVSSRPRPRQELSPGPWIAVIVVLVLAVMAYVWFTRPDAPSIGLPDLSTDDNATVSSPAVEETAAPADTDDAPVIDEPEPEPETETVTVTEAQAEPVIEPEPRRAQPPVEPPLEETSSPAIAEGQVRVLLTYTGDCWTEVTDATGRRLFFDLGRDGRSVELSGAEPLNVLFGSPGNVEVVVNGDDFALPATALPDRPLRLAIAGP